MATRCAGTGSPSLAEKRVIVAPALFRAVTEPLLPPEVEVHWFETREESVALAPLADMGWLDEFSLEDSHEAALATVKARWLHTTLAGLSKIPVDFARDRGIIVTNGNGLTSGAVADFALMGVLTLAKRFDMLVRAYDRKDWLAQPPGHDVLEDGRVLVIGYGSIGQGIGRRLEACGMQVTGVRRSADPDAGVIGAEDWRARLGDYDWIILAAPATSDTAHMIGAAEFAAMKPGAYFINIARGTLVDQEALVAALRSGQLGGAFLDVAHPEPLPADHPLWDAPNSLITMHMSGRFDPATARRAGARFARNVRAFLAGAPLESVVDLARGY